MTEIDTKFCQMCATRMPLEMFPLRTVRRKSGYVERRSFYCEGCVSVQFQNLKAANETEEGKAANRRRSQEAYADPVQRARHRERQREYRERIKQDPEKLAHLRKMKRKQFRRRRQRKSYQQYLLQQRIKAKELREDRKDLDPLVVPKGDPMIEWLYQEIDRYADERDLSGVEVVGDILGGKNWMRWRSSSTASGGRFMSLRLIDAVLVRLDLVHRLDDFTFYRRSDLQYKRLDPAGHQDDGQHDQDQDENFEESHGGRIVPRPAEG